MYPLVPYARSSWFVYRPTVENVRASLTRPLGRQTITTASLASPEKELLLTHVLCIVSSTTTTVTTKGNSMSLTNNGWREARACKEVSLSFFFPTTKGVSKKTIEICDKCPVEWECLNYAVTNGIEYGIWGGKTEAQRLPLIRAYHKVCGRPEVTTGLASE